MKQAISNNPLTGTTRAQEDHRAIEASYFELLTGILTGREPSDQHIDWTEYRWPNGKPKPKLTRDGIKNLRNWNNSQRKRCERIKREIARELVAIKYEEGIEPDREQFLDEIAAYLESLKLRNTAA